MRSLRIALTGAVALSLTVCLGCDSPYKPMRSLAISPEFSSEEIETIAQAAQDWCDVGSDLCVPVIITKARSGGSVQPSPPKKCVKKGTQFYGITVLSPAHAPRIHLCRNGIKLHEFYWLARHEIGHALSRREDHLPNGNTMMPDFPGGKKEDPGITKVDAEYVGAL